MNTIYYGCSNRLSFPAFPVARDEVEELGCVIEQDGAEKITKDTEAIQWWDEDKTMRIALTAEDTMSLEQGREAQVQMSCKTYGGTTLKSYVYTAFVSW